jgi:hypothetical protein
MKHFVLCFIIFGATACSAQKYALLDQHIAQPVVFANTVTTKDKFEDRFPVEAKKLKEFVDVLLEIQGKLSVKGKLGEAKQYEVGCAKFTGRTIPLAAEERMDYVLTSNCDDVKISMHLCDPKISNGSNVYFIKTWIQYIRSYMK